MVLAVLADQCELVSTSSVEILRDFIYLEGAPSSNGGNDGRFSRLKIVILRDASAVNPDEIAAKPDAAAQFVDQGGAKAIQLDALPGSNWR